MRESLKLLNTDYFDVYQLHGLVTMEDLETCFAPGGAMEVLRSMKDTGIARRISLTAHSEPVALRAIELYDFDTVMFPLNWHMHMAHGMGGRITAAAKKKGMGVLGIKSMIERAWTSEERYSSVYPKSWCKPFDIEKEPEMLLAAMKYSVSLGADVLIPPGNFAHFQFAVNHIDEVLARPLTEEDQALLSSRLTLVKDCPFYDPGCY